MNRNAQENRLRISRLHRLLRHNPANPLPLHVTVEQTADGQAAVKAGGIETIIPASGHRKPEDILRFMLKHYPEPAFINGEEVERAAFDETPTIIRISETGSFNSRMTRSDISGPAGKPAGLTLSEGLTYLNDADEGGRSRRGRPARRTAPGSGASIRKGRILGSMVQPGTIPGGSGGSPVPPQPGGLPLLLRRRRRRQNPWPAEPRGAAYPRNPAFSPGAPVGKHRASQRNGRTRRPPDLDARRKRGSGIPRNRPNPGDARRPLREPGGHILHGPRPAPKPGDRHPAGAAGQ